MYNLFVAMNRKNLFESMLESKFNLSDVGVDLVSRVDKNSLNFNVKTGRESELNQIIETLCKFQKNNVLLIGDSGVGKTFLVEQLAKLIAVKRVPVLLQNYAIFALNYSMLLSGTQIRGSFEHRVNSIIKALNKKYNNRYILFIDEIQNVLSGYKSHDSFTIDLPNILKPYLARGQIKTIACTTISEFYQTLNRDKAFVRRFRVLHLKPLEKKKIKAIATAFCKKLSYFHGISFFRDIVDAAIQLVSSVGGKYNFLDNVLDLLDTVFSKKRIWNLRLFNLSKNINQTQRIKLLNEILGNEFQLLYFVVSYYCSDRKKIDQIIDLYEKDLKANTNNFLRISLMQIDQNLIFDYDVTESYDSMFDQIQISVDDLNNSLPDFQDKIQARKSSYDRCAETKFDFDRLFEVYDRIKDNFQNTLLDVADESEKNLSRLKHVEQYLNIVFGEHFALRWKKTFAANKRKCLFRNPIRSVLVMICFSVVYDVPIYLLAKYENDKTVRQTMQKIAKIKVENQISCNYVEPAHLDLIRCCFETILTKKKEHCCVFVGAFVASSFSKPIIDKIVDDLSRFVFEKNVKIVHIDSVQFYQIFTNKTVSLSSFLSFQNQFVDKPKITFYVYSDIEEIEWLADLAKTQTMIFKNGFYRDAKVGMIDVSNCAFVFCFEKKNNSKFGNFSSIDKKHEKAFKYLQQDSFLDTVEILPDTPIFAQIVKYTGILKKKIEHTQHHVFAKNATLQNLAKSLDTSKLDWLQIYYDCFRKDSLIINLIEDFCDKIPNHQIKQITNLKNLQTIENSYSVSEYYDLKNNNISNLKKLYLIYDKNAKKFLIVFKV